MRGRILPAGPNRPTERSERCVVVRILFDRLVDERRAPLPVPEKGHQVSEIFKNNQRIRIQLQGAVDLGQPGGRSFLNSRMKAMVILTRWLAGSSFTPLSAKAAAFSKGVSMSNNSRL
jgi:hypothetical protein